MTEKTASVHREGPGKKGCPLCKALASVPEISPVATLEPGSRP